MKKILLVLGLLLGSTPAFAVATNTAIVVSSCSQAGIFGPAGRDAPLTVTTDGVLCNSSGGSVTQGTSPWVVSNGGIFPVQASGTFWQTTQPVGGYEFNAAILPTVQNAAYAAGQSLGGLQTISIGSTSSLSGILTAIRVASKGGSVVSMVAYVWSKNPAATTCTDKSNFVVSQADNAYLVTPPQLLAPALAVSAQDTTTYSGALNLVGNFINGSSNTNLYVCLLANAAVTPATTSDLRINIQGIKDQP